MPGCHLMPNTAGMDKSSAENWLVCTETMAVTELSRTAKATRAKRSRGMNPMDTGMMVFCVKTARWSCRESVEKAQWRSRKENDGVFLCQMETRSNCLS